MCVWLYCTVLYCEWHTVYGHNSRQMNHNRSCRGAPGEPSLSLFPSLGCKLGQWKQEVGPTVWLKHTAANIRLIHTQIYTRPCPRFLRSTQRTPLYNSRQGNRVERRAGRSSSSILSVWEFTEARETVGNQCMCICVWKMFECLWAKLLNTNIKLHKLWKIMYKLMQSDFCVYNSLSFVISSAFKYKNINPHQS